MDGNGHFPTIFTSKDLVYHPIETTIIWFINVSGCRRINLPTDPGPTLLHSLSFGIWHLWSKSQVLMGFWLRFSGEKNLGGISKLESFKILHSLKLTWHLKIGHPKRKVVFQPSIFRCYVSFWEGRWWFYMFFIFLPRNPGWRIVSL